METFKIELQWFQFHFHLPVLSTPDHVVTGQGLGNVPRILLLLTIKLSFRHNQGGARQLGPRQLGKFVMYAHCKSFPGTIREEHDS